MILTRLQAAAVLATLRMAPRSYCESGRSVTYNFPEGRIVTVALHHVGGTVRIFENTPGQEATEPYASVESFKKAYGL